MTYKEDNNSTRSSQILEIFDTVCLFFFVKVEDMQSMVSKFFLEMNYIVIDAYLLDLIIVTPMGQHEYTIFLKNKDAKVKACYTVFVI